MRDIVLTLLVGSILTGSFFAAATEKAVVVHNTLDEINGCTNKLKLKLVKVWGGDDEEDEDKFFKSPSYVAIDDKNHIYIVDSHGHNVKVFDRTGKYVRSLCQKGQGPGDLYSPLSIFFSPEGDLVVNEIGSRRIQYFNPLGKSKKILKMKYIIHWFGITSTNQLIVYRRKNTFITRILASLLDKKGKTVKNIGAYHDNSKSVMDSEYLRVALDGNDSIIVANSYTPVIRKYNLDGEMTAVFTYDTPFKLPVEVNLNERGDEIQIKRSSGSVAGKIKKTGSGHGMAFQRIKSRGILDSICKGIAVDSENRIYLLALKRERPLEEIRKIPLVMVAGEFFKVEERGLPRDREMDHLKILVFSPQGKVIAEAPVTKECRRIIISRDHLFIVDPYENQRILEYEIQFENNTPVSTQNEDG
ncbi:MAG: 6-bladed beta-propeller [bacterium]|nr:6-bladed beta-propeller [bacterium]